MSSLGLGCSDSRLHCNQRWHWYCCCCCCCLACIVTRHDWNLQKIHWSSQIRLQDNPYCCDNVMLICVLYNNSLWAVNLFILVSFDLVHCLIYNIHSVSCTIIDQGGGYKLTFLVRKTSSLVQLNSARMICSVIGWLDLVFLQLKLAILKSHQARLPWLQCYFLRY